MKVLHINGYDFGGGSETVFNITRINHNNDVNYTGCVKAENNCQKYDIEFIPYDRYPKLTRLCMYFFSLKNYSMLKKFLEQKEIDVIHLHNFIGALSPSILLAIKGAKKRSKFVVIQTAHDFNLCCPNSMLYNYSKNEICEKCLGTKWKMSPLLVGCDRRGKIYSFFKGIRSIIDNNFILHEKLIDAFIVPSLIMKSKLIEDGVDNTKLHVIRNPVPHALFKNDSKKNIICYFGRFSQEKDVPFIIRAFTFWKQKTNNDFRLHLIGSGEEEVKIHKMVAESLFRNEIIISKFMPEHELKEEIKNYKYFVMASRLYENAPMSILEAVSQGLVPIVPDLGGMKETVEDLLKVGKTYVPENIDSWCNAIDELEGSYDIVIEKINSVKEKLTNKFGVDSYLKNITMLYKKILEDKNL